MHPHDKILRPVPELLRITRRISKVAPQVRALDFRNLPCVNVVLVPTSTPQIRCALPSLYRNATFESGRVLNGPRTLDREQEEKLRCEIAF
jgi:hypothetical protein